jgi:hypothetical protein
MHLGIFKIFLAFSKALQLADFHAHEIHFHFVPSVFTISSNIAVGNRELLFV